MNKWPTTFIVLASIILGQVLVFAETVWQGTTWIIPSAHLESTKISNNFEYLKAKVDGYENLPKTATSNAIHSSSLLIPSGQSITLPDQSTWGYVYLVQDAANGYVYKKDDGIYIQYAWGQSEYTIQDAKLTTTFICAEPDPGAADIDWFCARIDTQGNVVLRTDDRHPIVVAYLTKIN